MGRHGWVTITIPTALYEEVERVWPGRSVPEFVRHAIQVMLLLERLRADSVRLEEEVERISRMLREADRRRAP